MELTALARACGKSNVHHLEPDDLVALTIEAAAMAKVPLAGTDWIPGTSDRRLTDRTARAVHRSPQEGRPDVRESACGRGPLRGFRARARGGAGSRVAVEGR